MVSYSELVSYTKTFFTPICSLFIILWGLCAHFFFFMYACMLSHFSRVRLYATLWTVACQVPLSMGFSRQESWSGFLWGFGGLLCPPPGGPPNLGIEPESLMSPAVAGGFFTASTTWEAFYICLSGYAGSLLPWGFSSSFRSRGYCLVARVCAFHYGGTWAQRLQLPGSRAQV